MNWLRVWWHCLWRMFVPGHRWCSVMGPGVMETTHFCKCGYR